MAIKTYQQGDLDGLCGPYAVHNALRRLLKVRTREAWDKGLFKAILRAIPKASYPQVLWKGLDIDELDPVARTAAQRLFDRHRIEVAVERPFEKGQFSSAKAYLKRLRKLTEPGFATALVGIEWNTVGGHWSVFRSFEDDTLKLYDSGRSDPFNLASLSINDAKRDRLCPEETIVFRLISIQGEPV